MKMRLYRRDLEAVSRRLEARSPVEILKWAHGTFGGRAAILSSMQRAGSVLCHMADRAGISMDVLFVDTGVLHKETLETRDAVAKSHTHLSVMTLAPARTFAEQTRDEGLLYLTREGQERCCDLRKSAPLRAIRGKYQALVSALRRTSW
jgi:phosphoadenosine phosphosulfate reductase